MKTFKNFTDCHVKACRSLKRRAILKISSRCYYRCLFYGFKMKPLREIVFQKNQLKFCRKTCWKEQPFIFFVYLMNHLFQTSVLFKCDNGMYSIELNWLCKKLYKSFSYTFITNFAWNTTPFFVRTSKVGPYACCS